MMTIKSATVLSAVAMLIALPASAQQGDKSAEGSEPQTAAAPAPAPAPAPEKKRKIDPAPPIEIQNYRAPDQRGINVFESPKHDGVPYEGFKLNFGAAFTQQFQALDHSNTALPNEQNGVNVNQLIELGSGFNNANANLYMNAQLAPGIRVALTTYLSSRHHPETWVKDGFLLVDESPLDVPVLNNIMQYVTLKMGHFEINYGDAHFRRSDNGNSMYNPFVGNLIMDAFTTEIGGEVYVRHNGLMAMGAVTGGEIRGSVIQGNQRAPSFITKLGFDRQMNEDLRLRLTGSMYRTSKSASNTLYGGDRAGSRYYYVIENVSAREASQFTSGMLNPGLRSAVTAYMINPFVKFRGLELFGVIETAEGRAANETSDRQWNQYSAEAIYRFLQDDKVYIGTRYNTVEGDLMNVANKVSVDRWQVGGGWFLTKNVLMKAEYVNQTYNDFPAMDIRNGGKFKGFMVEGVVAF
jgi:hypothetical protein